RLGLLAPGCDVGAALTLAESLRLAISEAPFGTPEQPISMTATLGYVTPVGDEADLDGVELLRRANLALARGTALGRNRAVTFERLRGNQDLQVQPARQLLQQLAQSQP